MGPVVSDFDPEVTEIAKAAVAATRLEEDKKLWQKPRLHSKRRNGVSSDATKLPSLPDSDAPDDAEKAQELMVAADMPTSKSGKAESNYRNRRVNAGYSDPPPAIMTAAAATGNTCQSGACPSDGQGPSIEPADVAAAPAARQRYRDMRGVGKEAPTQSDEPAEEERCRSSVIKVDDLGTVAPEAKPGQLPLPRAARKGLDCEVKALLASRVQPDLQDDVGMTALMWAASAASSAVPGNHAEVIRSLLDSRASIDAQDDDGGTALMHATANGWKAVAAVLANGRTVPSGCERAAMNTNLLRSIRTLLERRANVNHCSAEGLTPLMLAAATGSTSVTRLLLESGASIDDQDVNGWNALLWAASEGWLDVVRLLKTKGARTREEDGPILEALQSSST